MLFLLFWQRSNDFYVVNSIDLRNILNFISNSGLLLNLICWFIKNNRLMVMRLRMINILIICIWNTVFRQRCLWLIFLYHFLIIIILQLLIIFRIIIHLIFASIFAVILSLTWLFLKYLYILLRITIIHFWSFSWIDTLHIRERSINLICFFGIHNCRISQSARIHNLRSILKIILIVLFLYLLLLLSCIILLSLLKIVMVFVYLIIFSVIGSLIIWSCQGFIRIANFFDRTQESWINPTYLRFFQLWCRIGNSIVCKHACFLFFCILLI